MNCELFRQRWSDWHDDRPGCDPVAMARHRASCADCARYDLQMRRLLESLATLPLPDGSAPRWRKATPGRLRSPAMVARPRMRWAALAATLSLGIALGLLIGTGSDEQAPRTAEPILLEGAGEQQIALAFESPRALEQVEFVVELPEGVELAGFPGQREVRWQGRLAAGRSRLQLPLRVAAGADGGSLVTRLVHDGDERRLIVPLLPADGEASRHVAYC